MSTKGVGLRLDGREVLHDVSFSISEAEIVTIVGPNGSGKSSFLKILIGALKPSQGRMQRRVGLRIGYVPQRLQLDHIFPMTVLRFLKLGSAKPAEIAEIVERFGLVQITGQQLSSLSGGQLQRVLLANAMNGAPDLLVLDEAAQGLDQPAVAGFYRLIERMRREFGCAVLMVSHDLHVVMSASDRVICLNRHICCEGSPTIVSEAPEYRELFGYGTEGALALYRHEHDHEGHEHG
ncbi:MAG: metal ABC transporter ATP-binding protein [Alphaproteobacteria bacterium]|nr:metal ABC transporter ATP-binding protein [Alphaproteobacteria bacterium]